MLGEKVYELIERMYTEIQKGFKQMDEKLDKKVDKTDIARIENDHGSKLEALFDGYQSIRETLEDHTKRLQRIEEKIETHDIQIQVLDKTKSNKRKIK